MDMWDIPNNYLNTYTLITILVTCTSLKTNYNDQYQLPSDSHYIT